MIKGSCLCGRITFEVEGALEHPPEACHCSQCRKQSGHFLAAQNVRKDQLTVHGEEHVKWFQSSDKVKRGFCDTCGSTLFWQPLIPDYRYTAIALGLFDDSVGRKLSKHTFINDKGDYYDLGDGVPVSDEF